MFRPSPRVYAAVLGIFLVGCGRAPEPKAATPPATSPNPRVVTTTGDGEALPAVWGKVDLHAVPARITLPDPSTWSARRQGSFVVLVHPATRSEIALRVWRAERLARPSRCEAEARQIRPELPPVDPGGVVEQRVIDAPHGYDVRLVVGVDPMGARGVHGYALAVGAAVGRCYVAAYRTWADGPNAAERVAGRLALMVPGVIETVELPAADDRDVSALSRTPQGPLSRCATPEKILGVVHLCLPLDHASG